MKRLILILVSIFSIVFASQANIYTVTSNADAGTGGGLTGDLRYCINQAAGSAVGLPHTIIFSTAMTITINSDLQINAGNHNGITINGFVDGTDGPDVIIRSGGTLNNQMIFNNTVAPKIYGLVFQNLDYGIHLNTVTGALIKGCYFGTNAAGTAIVNGINQAGVYVQNGGATANNIIGGLLTTLPNGLATSTNNSERCIFAGCAQKTNAGAGVRVPALLVTDAGGTQVINNYFGIDATGTVKLGNGNQTTKMPLAHSNIYMNDALNSLIDRNVIAGATGSGIHLENWCNNTKIKGNKIGTNAAGTAAYNTTNSISFSNEAAGIFIQSGTGMVIGYDGGTLANERNIISGNGGAKHNNWQQTCDAGFSDYNQFGIYAESLDNSTFKGNYIGTDVTGNSSGTGNVFGNRAGGIKIVSVNGVGSGHSQGNTIGGGNTANDRNIISGNGYLWKANDNTSTCNGGTPSPSGMVSGPGLLLQYANTSSNTVSGNYVGLGADGTTALGNNANGVEIQGAASNNIGTAGVPNYIGNNTWGIFLQVDFGTPYVPAANNTIAGNVIGLTPTNTVAGNGVRTGLTEGGGIGLQMGVTGNKIGTAVANGGNVISGNKLGISIETNSVTAGATAPNANTIYNNIIGLDPTGTIVKPNTSFGVLIDMGGIGAVFPFNNTIGGTGANQANTISSNQQSGVYISHTAAITAGTANSIVGNKIGTNAAGAGDFGNTLQGIEIVNVSKTTITSNIISGNDQNGISLTGTTTNTISSNTISTNSVNGIFLSNASSNTISSNIIGTNASNGVALTGSSSNTIQSNTITSNTSNGISLAAASASNIILSNTINTNGVNGVTVNGATSINNAINQNSFSCNTGRGIVLASGGNASYAAPTIVGTQTKITWTGGVFIEVYETDGCATCPSDPTRLQGKTLIASGNSPFVFDVAAGFDKTKTYTATTSSSATGAHNTSEFSQCYTLCQNPTSVTITGSPLTFCAGGSVTLTANIVGGSGTETYVWKKDNVVIGGNTTTLVATASGSYTVEYSSTNTCTPTSSTGVTVTVNPIPAVTSSATGTICSGVAQNYTITASVASSFAWTRAVVTGISNTAVTNGSSNPIIEALTNTTTSAIDVVYLITPTSITGSCPATAAFTYTVTVNPAATVTNQTPPAICSGTAFNVTPTGVPAGTTYTWGTPSATGTVSGAVAQSTAQTSIGQTITNNGTTAATVVYTVTPKSGLCDGPPFTVTVTVNPKATVSAQTPAAICSGTAFTVTPTSVPAGTTYTWGTPNVTTGSVSGAVAQSTAQTSISQTLTNNGTTDATVVYTVTPKSGLCDGTAFTVTVTISPKANVTAQTPAAICSGNAFTVTPTGAPAGTTYTWGTPNVTTGSVSGAVAQSTAQTSISQTLTNNGITDATVVYTVTPKSGLCDGPPFTVTVTVNPKATVANQTPAAICSGSPFTVTPTNVPAGTTYTWGTPNVTTGSVSGAAAQPTAQTSISQTLTNTGTTAAAVIYTVTPLSGTCSSTAFTVAVTVNPNATVPNQTPDAICSGAAFSVTPTNVPSGTTYTWGTPNVTTGSVSGASAQSTAQTSISQTLTNTGATAATVVYTVTPKSGTCNGTPFTVTVTVNPTPEVSSLPAGSVCSGVVQNYLIESNVPAGFTWSRAVVTGIDNQAGSGSSNPITEALTNSTNAAVSVDYIIIPTSTTGACAGTLFTYTVSVDPKPVVSITPPVSTAFCSNASIDLTASAAGFTGGTFEWFNGSTSLGIQNPLTVFTAGTYTVVYTSTSSCASAPSASVTTTIKPDNEPAVVGNGFSTCLGTATLIGNVPTPGTGSTGTWSTTSSAVITAGTTPGTAEASGLVDGNTYIFTYTISGACGQPQTATIEVIAGLTGLSITAGGPSDTLCVGTNRSLTASAVGGSGNYSYVWVSSDGSFSSTSNNGANVTVKPAAGGETTYTVYVVDNVNIGCKTNDATVKLHAVEGQDLNIPNLITPNGDNKNDIFYLADKITGMAMIKEGSHVEVVNRWGSKVYEAKNYDNNWVPKDLTDGMYYYHITSSCGNKEYKSWLQILGNTNN